MSDPEEIVVSAQTLQRMQRELEELTTTGREAMSKWLRRGREFGENAEYEVASDALMEARIRRLEHMIKVAVVRATPPEADAAIPGVIVTLKPEGEDEPEEYLLASSTEERVPGVRTVTTSSPVGSAIVGKRVGDMAEVKAPAGTYRVEIVDLRPA